MKTSRVPQHWVLGSTEGVGPYLPLGEELRRALHARTLEPTDTHRIVTWLICKHVLPRGRSPQATPPVPPISFQVHHVLMQSASCPAVSVGLSGSTSLQGNAMGLGQLPDRSLRAPLYKATQWAWDRSSDRFSGTPLLQGNAMGPGQFPILLRHLDPWLALPRVSA